MRRFWSWLRHVAGVPCLSVDVRIWPVRVWLRLLISDNAYEDSFTWIDFKVGLSRVPLLGVSVRHDHNDFGKSRVFGRPTLVSLNWPGGRRYYQRRCIQSSGQFRWMKAQ